LLASPFVDHTRSGERNVLEGGKSTLVLLCYYEGKEVCEMTDKARRILALLKHPKHRERLMQSINRSTLDEGAEPVAGKDQEMKVLNEMNELRLYENDNWSNGGYVTCADGVDTADFCQIDNGLGNCHII
jgi:hypothetical protein